MPERDCLIWNRAKAGHGYGHHHDWQSGTMKYAHRTAYEAYWGPIPCGYEIDHLCGTIDCYNPLHLEAVQPRENHRRRMALIVACPSGHPYDESNTHINVNGARKCRTCDRERQRARRAA